MRALERGYERADFVVGDERLPEQAEPPQLFSEAHLGLLALYAPLGCAYSLYLKLSGKKPEQPKSPHYGILSAAYDNDDGPRCGYWRCKAERMSPSWERDGWVCVKCGKFVPFD